MFFITAPVAAGIGVTASAIATLVNTVVTRKSVKPLKEDVVKLQEKLNGQDVRLKDFDEQLARIIKSVADGFQDRDKHTQQLQNALPRLQECADRYDTMDRSVKSIERDYGRMEDTLHAQQVLIQNLGRQVEAHTTALDGFATGIKQQFASIPQTVREAMNDMMEAAVERGYPQREERYDNVPDEVPV